jgi:hypothetical protein
MTKDSIREKILKEFNEGLNNKRSIESDYINLIFYNAYIFVVLFDSRLNAGENTRKVMFANEITESEFVTATEKVLTVYNNPIRREYKFRTMENDLVTPPIEEVIAKIKQDLPHLVDSFIEQIERNNKYINPKSRINYEKHSFNTDR